MVRALWCVACVIAVGLVNARAPAIESKADSVIITVDDGQDVTVQYLDVDDNMVATASIRDLYMQIMTLQGQVMDLTTRMKAVETQGATNAASIANLAQAEVVMDLKSDVAENTAAIGEVKTSTVDNKAIADGAAEKAMMNAQAITSLAQAQAVVDLQSDVMDNTAAIAVLNATSSNKPGQSECNAASSCLALKDTCGDAGNGVYWLRAPKSGKAYQAYCDMERGGYEVVWKNVGNHPNVGLSNFNMREEGLGRMQPVMPPSDLTSQVPGMSEYWEEHAATSNYEWIKVATAYDKSSGDVLLEQTINVDFGETTTMNEIFAFSSSRCRQLSSAVSVYVNGKFEGTTDQVLVANDQSYGLANSGHGSDDLADACGLTEDHLINVGSAFTRYDSDDAGDNSIRHLFSYIDNDAGRDSSRCQYCCWGCTDKSESFYWALRPRMGLGSEFAPANSCYDILGTKFDRGSGIYWLQQLPSISPYQAYCDMETEGGGWEIVHKNAGGPGRPVAGTISNQKMRDGTAARFEPLLPPLDDRQRTHTSGMSNSWHRHSQTKHMEWMKVSKGYKSNGDLIDTRSYVVEFTQDATMEQVFATPSGTFCHEVPGIIKVSLNGENKGQTNLVNSYQSGGNTYGLASTSNQQDQCGQSSDNYISSSVRHLFSYVDDADGYNAVRCEFCCWESESSSGCNVDYESLVWGVRPANRHV